MTLNPEQLEAVHSAARNVVVVAAPGSGKTRVIVERYAMLHRANPLDAQSSVIITYTVKAASELRERIRSHPEQPKEPNYVGTLHSYLLRLLRSHGDLIGMAPDISVADEETSHRILKECVETLGWKKPFSQAEKAVECKSLTDVKAQALFTTFHRRMERAHLISYDGILEKGFLLLLNHASKVAKASHLMVDEYQDVSLSDHQTYLHMPAVNRFVVGDKRQAIFGFRGGSTEPLESLTDNPNWHCLELRTNYRSDVRIIDAANGLMAMDSSASMKAFSPIRGTVQKITIDTPEQQMVVIGDLIKQHGSGSIAVICRYNWHCEEIATYLRSAGIKVRQKRRQAEPQGWKAVRTLVAFYAAPDNDELAYSVLAITQSEAMAKLARQQAAAQVTSINRSTIRMPVPKLDDVLPLLVRANVSRECLDMVEKIQNELPIFSTVSDLSAAIQSGYALEGDDGSEDGVTVCTVHASKGLEYDVVFMPYFNDEVYPGKKADGLEEARRLAFVGITRARHALYITATKSAKPFVTAYKTEPATPSRYIQEMGLL
jgi:DNA helicase II / ATP-dependent DNA helicase PcrA